MDFEIRDLPEHTIVGLSGPLSEIGSIWERLGPRYHDGTLHSSHESIESLAATLPSPSGLRYVAGVPFDHDAPAGLGKFGVPGGRYAVVNHRGSHEQMKDVMGRLYMAVVAAGHTPAGEQIEIYYFTQDESNDIDMGVRLRP